MTKGKKVASVSRRGFLATTGSLIATAPAVGRSMAPTAGETPLPRPASPPAPKPSRKIPIGVFDSAYNGLMDQHPISTEEMIDKMSALGLEAVEIGSGALDRDVHCPTEELLADPAKANAWKKKFTDHNIMIGALGAAGNPIHPDQALAAKYDKAFRNAVLLAERLEIPIVRGLAGCPAAGPEDKNPNFIFYSFWPQLEWQWKEKVIPYWKGAAAFAREHNVKIAIEMHAGHVVYNPKTLLRLREAVGETIGANCDLSHLFWQGCDPVEVIHYLGGQGAIYHAHMKDTFLAEDIIAKTGILNPPINLKAEREKGPEYSFFFRSVGYGHGAQQWKEIVKAYMDTGFPGMLSIEMEDPFLATGEEGVARSFYVLKNVRAELLAQSA